MKQLLPSPHRTRKCWRSNATTLNSSSSSRTASACATRDSETSSAACCACARFRSNARWATTRRTPWPRSASSVRWGTRRKRGKSSGRVRVCFINTLGPLKSPCLTRGLQLFMKQILNIAPRKAQGIKFTVCFIKICLNNTLGPAQVTESRPRLIYA